jgi:hypothetical protein
VYGLGLIGQEEGGAYGQYHFDARGSTVLLTDANGAVTDSFAYGPYGEAWGRTGYTSTPFQFNGRYGVTTEPNGLLCMRARFYHPILRRFLNQVSNATLNATRSALFATEAKSIVSARGSVATDD